MNGILSLLGTAMLMLVSVAAVLAVIILVLYEACWIVRLGGQLHQSARIPNQPCVGSELAHNKRGVD
jgi:hypothetical protein